MLLNDTEREGGEVGREIILISLLSLLGELKYIEVSKGVTLSLVYQQGTYYILNTELQSILPQANQNVIAPLRSLLNIPLEYASRYSLSLSLSLSVFIQSKNNFGCSFTLCPKIFF